MLAIKKQLTFTIIFISKTIMKLFFTFFIGVLFYNTTTFGQLTASERQRLISFQSYIDKAQDALNKIDGKKDSLIKISKNDDLNLLYTDVLLRQVNEFQATITADKVYTYDQRKGIITATESFINAVNNKTNLWMRKKNKTYQPAQIQTAFNAFTTAANLTAIDASIKPVLEANDYETAQLIATCDYIKLNVEKNKLQGILAFKYAKANPSDMIKVLKRYANEIPNADSILKASAYKYPNTLYSYLQDTSSKNMFNAMVLKINDTLLNLVSAVAKNNNGQKIMPFLDNILKGKQTLADVDRISGGNDSLAFYKLLVKTQIDYAKRMLANDTPMLYTNLNDKLKEWSYTYFVAWINEYHDKPESYRMRSAENLNATEIYYLLTQNEEEIFTSTYRLLFDRMIARAPNRRGDTLMQMVNLDKYKKFIKLAANFNRLSPFLNSMPSNTAKALMEAFVTNLDKSIEEATDVADAYSSIKDTSIKVTLRNKIAKNLTLASANQNLNAERIYKLEYDVMQGFEDPKFNWQTLGVASPYEVTPESLLDSTKGISMLMFFYGDKDKDGQNSFQSFLGTFSDGNWRIDQSNNQWVTLAYKKSKVPIIIYANRPFYNPKAKPEPDAQAQEDLINFLKAKKIEPKIIVHRGHSYHTIYTIEQIYSQPKMVFLGSCGGYKLLQDVMDKGNDVHIVSTKQVGSMSVNNPMLKYIASKLGNGENINWPKMWETLAAGALSGNKDFLDYIPPHKNLGALFLKAYQNSVAMGPNP